MTTPNDVDHDDSLGTPLEAEFLSVSLTAKELKASVDWYTRVLGFRVEQEHVFEGTLRAVSLRAGSVRVLLNQDDGARGWDRVKGEGFSLHFNTAQDVDAVADRVRNAGGTLASEPADMPWGARVFRILDPDGYKLSVSTVPGGD